MWSGAFATSGILILLAGACAALRAPAVIPAHDAGGQPGFQVANVVAAAVDDAAPEAEASGGADAEAAAGCAAATEPGVWSALCIA